MAPVIVAAGVAALAGGAGVVLGTVTLASAVGSIATTAVLAGASYLLQDKAGAAQSASTQPTAAPANAFRTVTQRQPVPPRRYVLGRTRTAGVMFYLDNVNPDLYIGTLLSDGVIESVETIYIGSESVPIDGSGDATAGSLFAGSFNAEIALGEDDQAASAVLLAADPSLSSDFRQRGVARVVTTHYWGDDSSEHQTLWSNGLEPTFLVEGVKVFDQRVAGHDVNARGTWEHSDNPAWLIAFVLLSAWDVALGADDLDLDSFEAAADDFDATLTFREETVAYFKLAGIFQSGFNLAEQLDDMLRSCGASLTFSDGKYGLAVDKARSSVWTITDADVLELGEYTAAGRIDETPTAVKARYFDANDQGNQKTTPVYQHSAVATEGYRESVIDLGYCPDEHSAQILAYRELIKARDGRQLSLTVHDAGLYLAPLDRVTISFDNASFLDGEYTVVQVDLSENGCILSLRGYDADAYATPSTYLIE